MQKSNKGQANKASDFDAAFEKFANKLPKEYTAQFKKNENKGPSKEAKVKEALRTGKPLEIVSKGVGNKHGEIKNIGKLLADDAVLEIKEVPKEIASQVARIRAEKKLTQEQLATKIMEKPAAIKDLEAATGVYDPKLIEKIEKHLGVKIDRPWKK